MKTNFITIPKYPDSVNEDAVGGDENHIVVSDGAGGGGVFADRWSRYLVDNLPTEPITSIMQLDKWLDGIWESFYKECEAEAQKKGGLLLDKFYDEGSFATLAAVWFQDKGQYRWIKYGDSIVFCYYKNLKILDYSSYSLSDFDRPPHLIGVTEQLKIEGLVSGGFNMIDDAIVFAASDALSHYIIMMYEVSWKKLFQDELQEALDARSRNSNAIRAALALKPFDFEKDVLQKLLNCRNNRTNLQRHLNSLRRKGLLAEDDYSLAVAEP